MKLIVTGGAGFIGSNLCEELSKNHDVFVIDDFSEGKEKNLEELDVEYIRGNIMDQSMLKKAFKDADYVFHHAAIASVQKSIEDPFIVNEINIGGTLNVLTAARDCQVKKVIFASSSAVYGDNSQSPKRENMMPNPKSPYSVSKVTGEYYCKTFLELYGLKTVNLRYFNVYGPKQDHNSEYSAVIPKFITKIIHNEHPIIYGDGNQTRDFVFVKDVVNANILAMKSEVEGTFNIAHGQKTSVKELFNCISTILNTNVKPFYVASKTGEVRDSLADISLATEKFAYKPDYTLEEGLKETIKWYYRMEECD